MRSRRAFRSASALAVTAAAATVGGALAASPAQAAPTDGHYVKTLHCRSADPLGGPPLRIGVDVWNRIPFPSDGLPGPAIALIATAPRPAGLPTYTVETRVAWHNVDNGRRGVVRVPTRTNRVTWQAVLHPGAGKVNFTITQKIGAVVFVPMVNPQTSTCRGSATA